MACDGNVTCAEEVRDELVNGLQSLWLLLCTWLGEPPLAYAKVRLTRSHRAKNDVGPRRKLQFRFQSNLSDNTFSAESVHWSSECLRRLCGTKVFGGVHAAGLRDA